MIARSAELGERTVLPSGSTRQSLRWTASRLRSSNVSRIAIAAVFWSSGLTKSPTGTPRLRCPRRYMVPLLRPDRRRVERRVELSCSPLLVLGLARGTRPCHSLG